MGWDWTSAVPADTKAAVFPRRPGVQQYDLRVMTSPGEGGESAEFPGFSRLLVRNCFTGIYVGCRSAPHFGVSNTNTPRRFFDQAASL